VTAYEDAAESGLPRAAEKPRRRRPGLGDLAWRHVVAVVAVFFALFPVVYVVSAAFNADDSLGGASLIPREWTFDNFTELFTNEKEKARATPTGTSLYPRWYVNTLVVATGTAILTVMLSALAAYAFSRFRFRGRRTGMLMLFLVQLFPQLLAVVAIYLIVLQVGDIFDFLALNQLSTLMIVYLGGALGVNTWLMKGFFDTIPSELDESARVDGATPAQVFWGVVLPLAAPVLSVIGLISFVTTVNEFVIASVILQDREVQTLPVGLFSYIDEEYAEHWGPFAAGVLLAAVPAVLLFTFLQRYIVQGLTQGSVKG
jgi:arabinogalactan oligomer / maltooligosaccharide transport system permease protein